MSHNMLSPSSIDFLKSCSTGVNLVPGFSAVHYWLYAAESLSNTSSHVESKSVEDALLEIEIAMRDRRDLVNFDAQRKSAWVFAGASDSTIVQQPGLEKGNLGIEKHGWTFKLVLSGMFKASELSMYSSKLASAHSPSPFQAPGPPQGQMTNVSPAASARTPQQSAASSIAHSANGSAAVAYDKNDLRSVYASFVRAVQSSFAYTLAKDCKALQLDSRTFVYVEPEGNGMRSDEDALPLTLFTTDHSLANGGGMLVSTSIVPNEDLYSCTSTEATATFDGSEIIIAPGGLSAVALLDHTEAESVHIRQWKSFVRTQLRSKGIDLARLDPQDRWLLLKTPGPQVSGEHPESKIFYWPVVLCFSRTILKDSFETSHDRGQAMYGQSSDKKDGVYWFESPDQGGYKQPLRVAEDWYNNKAGRDKIIEERRKRIEMIKKQAENASLSVTSPAYTRDGLQVTAGVYPTPPDGLLSQMSHAHAAQEIHTLALPVDQSAHRTSLDMQHSDMMDLDMGPFEDNVRQRPSLISRGSLDATAKMGGEDFFGDLEDEDLRGQDVTDADFSFFDEPEVPEAMIIDGGSDGPTDPIKREDTDILSNLDDDSTKPRVHVPQSPVNDSSKDSTHLRSSLPAEVVKHAEEVKDSPISGSGIPSEKQDVIPEALDPESIRRKLFEFGITYPSTGRRNSQFQPLAFNTTLQRNDAKYGQNGTFAFKVQTYPPGHKLSATSPRIKPRPPDEKGQRLNMPSHMCITSPNQAVLHDSDSSSDFTDSSDDESGYQNGFRSLVTSPVKGKFQDDTVSMVDDTQSVPGSNPLFSHLFTLDSTRQTQLLSILLYSPITSHALWTDRTFSLHEGQPQNPVKSPSMLPLPSLVHTEGALNPFHKDFINVAQIVAEQVSIGFVNDTKQTSTTASSLRETITVPTATPLKLRSILTVVRSCYTTMIPCDLLNWLCLQEAVPEKASFPKGHPAVPQKKAAIPGLQTSDGAPVPSSALSPLYPPHVRVRRNEGLWDVLPPALPFWEQLGLAPAAGRKNVMALCVYPGNNDLRSQISIFMDYLGATFESCKLGAHVRATQLASIINGMVPVELSSEASLQSAFSAVRDVCVELGKLLANIDWNSKLEFNPAIEDLSKIDNFVIYMVNPFKDDSRGMMELCASFWALYETYRQAVASPMLRASQPDVVLQILPIRYVADPHAPVTMDTAFYQKLAREVYDRCPPSSSDKSPSRLPIESAPAVQLEQSLPRKIDFKLQSDPPPDLLHEGSNLHLGYSKSSNGEWVSVAWTDGTGKYQASASYCLVGGRTFIEVARVIWQSTLEIMQARRVAWRLCIARVGALEKEELDIWSMLATSASSVMMITVLMSVDPDPSVTVFQDQLSVPSKLGGHTSTQTPVGTPRSGVSPDTVLTPAATPNTESGPDVSNDPDAHLVDVGDETWGLILGHRTNVSGSIADYRPSLSTGFLMKSNTASTSPLDNPDENQLKGLILVGVKLVWIGSSPKPVPLSQSGQQPSSALSMQSPFSAMPSSSPTEAAASGGLAMPPTPSPTSAPGQQQSGQLNTSTNGSSIPKVTADSILRDYLQMYRNLGVLARARGLRGTKRGALPWHVVVALRAAEGLEATYGTIQANS